MGMHGLRVFSDLCVGCPCCMTACKAEKGIMVMDVNPLEIEKKVTDTRDGETELNFIIHACRQCDDAPCVESCPEKGALVKREDGTVIVNEELCTGMACKKCLEACPYDAIKLDQPSNTVVKCDLCYDRVESGRQPACVQACPAKVIYVGEISKIEADIEQRRAEVKKRRDRNKQEMEKKWSEARIEVPYFDI